MTRNNAVHVSLTTPRFHRGTSRTAPAALQRLTGTNSCSPMLHLHLHCSTALLGQTTCARRARYVPGRTREGRCCTVQVQRTGTPDASDEPAGVGKGRKQRATPHTFGVTVSVLRITHTSGLASGTICSRRMHPPLRPIVLKEGEKHRSCTVFVRKPSGRVFGAVCSPCGGTHACIVHLPPCGWRRRCVSDPRLQSCRPLVGCSQDQVWQPP